MLFDDLDVYLRHTLNSMSWHRNSDSRTCVERKKEGNDQESIQSSTTPDPGYQVFFNSDNVTVIKTSSMVVSSNSIVRFLNFALKN